MGSHAWFQRRPLYWCGLAAAVAVLAAIHLLGRPALCIAAGGAVLAMAALAMALRWKGLALMLAAAGLLLLSTARSLAAPEPPLLPGRRALLYGEVEAAWSGRGAVHPALLRVRLVADGGSARPAEFICGAALRSPAQPGDWFAAEGEVRRPSGPSYPGDRSDRNDWLRRGAHWVLTPRGAGIRITGEAAPGWANAQAAAARKRIREWFNSTLSPTSSLLAGAMLLGDKGDTTPDFERLRELYLQAGLLHLLVVSGAQVSLLSGLFIWLGWRWFRLRWLIWPMVVPLLLAYHLVTGGDSSITRATWLGVLIVIGLLMLRRPDLLNLLGATAFGMLLLEPPLALDYGAALSFTAVWSIATLGASLARMWTGQVNAARPLLSNTRRAAAWTVGASIAASMGAGILTALFFGRISWMAPVANLLAGPLVSLLLPLSAFHAVLGAVGFQGLAPGVELLSHLLQKVVALIADLPLATAPALIPPAPVAALVLICIGASRHLSRGPALSAWTLATALLLVGAACLPAPAPRTPEAVWLQLPQRPLLVLRSPSGSTVVVGGGQTDRLDPPAVMALRALRINRIDLALLDPSSAGLAAALRAGESWILPESLEASSLPEPGAARVLPVVDQPRRWTLGAAVAEVAPLQEGGWLLLWSDGPATIWSGDRLDAVPITVTRASPPGAAWFFRRGWSRPAATLARLGAGSPAVLVSTAAGGRAAAAAEESARHAGISVVRGESVGLRWAGGWVIAP